MQLCIAAAKFTPGEANQLRRAMATFRHVGRMDRFYEKMVGGMVARGYEKDFAERCYSQIQGFGSYGFPESHALSFARLVYVSSYLKCRYPAVFCTALLNSQPMGFYAPAQIVRDAREHGVEVLAIDVNASGWDSDCEVRQRPLSTASRHPELVSGSTLLQATRSPVEAWTPDQVRGDGACGTSDPPLAVRLGLRQIDGFREEWANAHRRTWPLCQRRGPCPPRTSARAGAEAARRCRRAFAHWGSTGARGCGRCAGRRPANVAAVRRRARARTGRRACRRTSRRCAPASMSPPTTRFHAAVAERASAGVPARRVRGREASAAAPITPG